jgi:hypothetical protein
MNTENNLEIASMSEEELDLALDRIVEEIETELAEADVDQTVNDLIEEIEADLAEAELNENIEAIIAEMELEEQDSDEEIDALVEEIVSEIEAEMELEEQKRITVTPEQTRVVRELIESDDSLSEEFKAKAVVIFKNELETRLEENAASLQEEYEMKLAKLEESAKNDIALQVEQYLEFAIANWMVENKVAIESSIRTELSEKFINSLRGMFVENYVDIPESKVDLFEQVEEEAAKSAELLDKTNSVLEDTITQLEETTRENIVLKESEGLVMSQAEKLQSMAEKIDFESAHQFLDAVKTLKEFYFNGDQAVVLEDEEDENEYFVSGSETIVEELDTPKPIEPKRSNDPMAKYASAMGRLNRTSQTRKLG